MSTVSNVNSIGYLDANRLALIPPKHWKEHEFCFFLHDQMVQLLVEYESSGAHNWVMEGFEKELAKHGIDGEVDLLEFLKEHNLIHLYKHHLMSHLVLALTGDMLNFLYEALSCFEKRKISVAFSLLRKPLKENLLFLSWILGDQDDFISRFEFENHKSLNKIGKEKKIKIFSDAINMLAIDKAFDAETIWNIIYSKNHSNGFEPTWQRATHLITSYGDFLKTGNYSINFIFDNPFDNDYYDFLYQKLSYLYIFITQIVLESFSLVMSANESTFSHLTITTMGCYEAICLKERYLSIAQMLNRNIKYFLKCLHCGSNLRINRTNAPTFYIREEILCKKCGLISDIPLYWIICNANLIITRKNTADRPLGKLLDS